MTSADERLLEQLHREFGEHERQVFEEAHDGVKIGCSHENCGWAVMHSERGHGQIRWTCLDCGWRERVPQPNAQHPDRDSYPLLIPRKRWRKRPSYEDYLNSEDWQERRTAVVGMSS